MAQISEARNQLKIAGDNLKEASIHTVGAREDASRTGARIAKVLKGVRRETPSVAGAGESLKSLKASRTEAESSTKDAMDKVNGFVGEKHKNNEQAQAVQTFGSIALDQLTGKDQAGGVALPETIKKIDDDGQIVASLFTVAEKLGAELVRDLGVLERGLEAVTVAQLTAHTEIGKFNQTI